jgi:hypothetical protein
LNFEGAGRNRKGQGAGGSRADIPRLIIFGFSKEGLRNLGKFSRGLPKLIWDLHTNFAEIKMQEIRVQRNNNPNIPNKKNLF